MSKPFRTRLRPMISQALRLRNWLAPSGRIDPVPVLVVNLAMINFKLPVFTRY